MSRHYVVTPISLWSTFSFAVNLCNCQLCYFQWHAQFLLGPPITMINAGVSYVLVKSWRWSFKICCIHDFIHAYLATTCLNGYINHPRKRVCKSYSVQCDLRSLIRIVCQTPHVYIAETWRRPQPVVCFTRGFRVFFKFDGNVSNKFKYLYVIYWAFMFLPQLGRYGLCRNMWRDYIGIPYLIWITIRNSLVK